MADGNRVPQAPTRRLHSALLAPAGGAAKDFPGAPGFRIDYLNSQPPSSDPSRRSTSAILGIRR